ncbi:sigma-54-dependent Fis family transcriptional regulator [Panacagrimonas sp.]|uniref:sigma-54-dependent Fis family transcriptional regulator n=1 Tax=Panacagrimonas sp. TaxID=2480088 RepID=UPI003B519048
MNHRNASPPMDLNQSTKITRAWEAFLSGQHVPEAGMRRMVLASWQRSHSQQVDPKLSRAPVDTDRLVRAQSAHSELIESAAPILCDTERHLREAGVIVLLCSPSGQILELRGSRKILDLGLDANITPGGLWHEDVCGTNAVGTAIMVDQPIQLYGPEHFCEGIKRWTCAASLIKDPVDGRLLGALDLSYNDARLDVHALPLVISAARRIEANLYGREMKRQHFLLENYVDRYAHRPHDGLLLLDRCGRLLRWNEHAPTALARLGITLPLKRGTMLEEGLATRGGIEDRCGPELPAWIKPDWVHPLVLDGHRAGSVVIVPVQAAARLVASSGNSADHGHGACDARLAGHRSLGMRRALEQAERVAALEIPLLIEGETGTGKEVLAREIHQRSGRRGKPFIAVNCGAIPRELLASELFGHTEGAFTGARRGGHAGKFEQAHGGTLFLDELGELPLDLQPYLLRAIECKELVRLGSASSRPIDVRIIAATNRSLRKQMACGQFRDDLFYRFHVSIVLPPLRERREDMDRYIAHCLEELARRHGLHRSLHPRLISALKRHSFPGNLRELHNLVEQMAVMSDRSELDLPDLPEPLCSQLGQSDPVDAAPQSLRRSERQAIFKALSAERGHRGRAAQRLGISRTTLYRRLIAYGVIDEPVADLDTADSARPSMPQAPRALQ